CFCLRFAPARLDAVLLYFPTRRSSDLGWLCTEGGKMKLKAKINVYTAGMFILLLILLNILIYFSFNRILFENETDRSNAEALKAVKGLNEADKSLKTGDLLR